METNVYKLLGDGSMTSVASYIFNSELVKSDIGDIALSPKMFLQIEGALYLIEEIVVDVDNEERRVYAVKL